jgi:uncharacterized membrane protein
MTASKSSRARNARAQRTQTAQANAARNGGGAGRANGTSAAVKPDVAVKAGAPAVKAGAPAVKAGTPAVKAGTPVKGGTAVKAGSQPRVVAGGGGPDRRGSRGPALTQEAIAEAPASTTVPLWMQLATFGLALAGLGVSIYLTIAHFTESALAGCSESGLVNCTKVTTSPQSYAFGIPVAVLGLAFYLAAVVLMSPWAWRSPRYRREIYLIRLASLVVGMGFVLYLLYAELFIIGSICLYCTSVHAITFVLFGLIVFAAAAWGIPERQRG